MSGSYQLNKTVRKVEQQTQKIDMGRKKEKKSVIHSKCRNF